jgi:hypothetical protein
MPTTTYEPIATTTFSSTTGSFTFSSIPQTYKSLRLIARCSFSAANFSLNIRPNANTANTKQTQHLYSAGAIKGAPADSNTTYWYGDVGQSSGQISNPTTWVVDFNNYTAFGQAKGITGNCVSFTADTVGNMYQDHLAGYTDATTAISSLVILSGGTTFAVGDTLTLFGLGA